MLEQPWHSGGTVQEALTAKIGDLKENLQIVQACAYSNDGGQVVGYVHHDNKKGALVHVTTSADAAKAAESLKQLCMHIVVFSPSALDESGIDANDVEREKEIIKDGLAGKPEDIQAKIMEGRLQKFFAERTLVGQPIQLTGFMHPLEQRQGQRRFLLSPYPAGCAFHAPSGPASTIEVFADAPARFTYEPVAVQGVFALAAGNGQGVRYQLHTASVEELP